MRICLIILSMILGVGAFDVRAQVQSSSKPYVIRLPRDSEPASLWIEYYLTGPFGGYGSYVSTASNVWDYEIPTSVEGKPAETMRVIVNGRKYYAQIFSFAAGEGQDRVINLKMEQRPTVRFTGKIVSRLPFGDKRLQISVGYLEHWKCEYFGQMDCLVSANPIASVAMGKDGKFSVELPDISKDPVVVRFRDRGAFQFLIRDENTGNILYRLRPAIGGQSDALPVLSGYPIEQNFTAEPWNK